MDFHFSPYTSFFNSIHRFNSNPAQKSVSRQPTAAESPTLSFNTPNPVKKPHYNSGMDNLNRHSPL